MNFLLYYISLPLAATAFMVAGICLVAGGSENAIKRGKSILTSTVIGLLIAFGAWVIINTILGNLLSPGYVAWNQFPSSGCTANQPTPSPTPTPTPSPTPTSTPTPTPTPTPPSGTDTEQQARDFLSQNGIGVKADCPVGQSTDCVDLEGVKQSTLNEVSSLASQVGASNVYVTAGTEGGCGAGFTHNAGMQSHCTGDKVDLRVNSTLNNYIQTNYAYIGQRSDGAAQYKAPDGSIYAREGGTQPHWDVLAPAIKI